MDKTNHCCGEIKASIDEGDIIYDTEEWVCYSLQGPKGRAGIVNFCPFCGTVLPGALVTDWEKHENCDACHWTGPPNPAIMPKCICSQGYEELKRIQDETNQSN
jgi:hypothetical protein